MIDYRGLFHVLVTPFSEGGDVDEHSLRDLVGFAIESGAVGLVALGVMGEASELDDSERAHVLRTVRSVTADQVPLVVGVSASESETAAERARLAAADGADAVMVAVPPDPQRLGLHLSAVADSAPGLEIVLQDYPKTGHPPVTARVLAQAAESVPSVRAVKAEDAPTSIKVRELSRLKPNLSQLGGLGGLWCLWELEAGACGSMTGFAVPELLVRVIEAAHRGDWSAARAKYAQALPALVWEAQPGVDLALRKAMLVAQGVIASDQMRAPRTVSRRLAGEHARRVAAHLSVRVEK